MHRFYSPPDQCNESALFLTDREAHHALKVLRIRRGDTVIVLDGAGSELVCTVQDYDRDKVQLAIAKRNRAEPTPFKLTLLQAVPKGKIIESIIQKATELGVARIVPLLTERVSTKLDHKAASQKEDKWSTIAIESIKQCGAQWLPKVEAPTTPEEFIARNEKFDLPLVASLFPGSRHPRDYFFDYERRHLRRPVSVCVWVGPEGDFTNAEVSAITASGALPITLGTLVLRVETAATYCLSVVNYELQSPALSGFTKPGAE